jgi:hypothetical protein
MPILFRDVELEGFTFKVKPNLEPFEDHGYYLLFNETHNTFRIVKINAEQLQIDHERYRRLSGYQNQHRIFYKLESQYIDDNANSPEKKVQFNGRIGDLYELDGNSNRLVPQVGHNHPSVIFRSSPINSSRGRRSSSRGGNKKTRKNKKRKTKSKK